jgi:hypothetical protein
MRSGDQYDFYDVAVTDGKDVLEQRCESMCPTYTGLPAPLGFIPVASVPQVKLSLLHWNTSVPSYTTKRLTDFSRAHFLQDQLYSLLGTTL